jgi:hypothetical protein
MLALPVLIMSGCATVERVPAPVARVEAPAIRVGDRWLYDEINAYNGLRVGQLTYEVKQAQPNGALVLGITSAGKPISAFGYLAEEINSAAWAVQRDGAYDMVNDYEPALPVIPFPVSEGERRTYAASVVREPNKERDPWRVDISVGPWERVRVPAGEFSALRVERRIWFAHPDHFRIYSSRFDTLWYAPEVGRWVKREWTGYYNLRYSPRRGYFREDWVRWELREFKRSGTTQAVSATQSR